MKRLTALFLCITLFSALFLTGANAEPAITKAEAAELIDKMYKFKETISGSNTDLFLGELPEKTVTDRSVYERLCEKLRYKPEMELLSLPEGEYGTLSFWHDHIKKFMTDDYVENNVILRFGLIELDDKVYMIDPVAYMEVPGFPHLCECGLSLEDHLTLVDSDTVLLAACFDGFDPTKYEVDFEYTYNGWRICGGEATERFMRRAIAHDNTNPETADSATPVIICLLVSSIGVGVVLKKRRHG